jgi:hypothetical protein
MTVTIELKPEMEASLSALTAPQGVDLARLVERLLEDQLPKVAAPMPPPNVRRLGAHRFRVGRLVRRSLTKLSAEIQFTTRAAK